MEVLVLVAAVATKAIWRSRYGRGRAAVVATMVGRMVGKENGSAWGTGRYWRV